MASLHCYYYYYSQMCNMLGLGDMNADQLASKLEETLPVIRSVSEQFKDPVSIIHLIVSLFTSHLLTGVTCLPTLCLFIFPFFCLSISLSFCS